MTFLIIFSLHALDDKVHISISNSYVVHLSILMMSDKCYVQIIYYEFHVPYYAFSLLLSESYVYCAYSHIPLISYPLLSHTFQNKMKVKEFFLIFFT